MNESEKEEYRTYLASRKSSQRTNWYLKSLDELKQVKASCTKPKLLICDEVTTALDVLIQEQILELLRNLNEDYGMTILFISHDLHVVKKICKSVLVMERGKIVERGETAEVFARPQHAYTKKLIASIPARAERCRTYD